MSVEWRPARSRTAAATPGINRLEQGIEVTDGFVNPSPPNVGRSPRRIAGRIGIAEESQPSQRQPGAIDPHGRGSGQAGSSGAGAPRLQTTGPTLRAAPRPGGGQLGPRLLARRAGNSPASAPAQASSNQSDDARQRHKRMRGSAGGASLSTRFKVRAAFAERSASALWESWHMMQVDATLRRSLSP